MHDGYKLECEFVGAGKELYQRKLPVNGGAGSGQAARIGCVDYDAKLIVFEQWCLLIGFGDGSVFAVRLRTSATHEYSHNNAKELLH